MSFGRAIVPLAELSTFDRLRAAVARTDWTPDLGSQIGTLDWWRGVATCAALCAGTWMLAPSFDNSIVGVVPAPLDGHSWDEARA